MNRFFLCKPRTPCGFLAAFGIAIAISLSPRLLQADEPTHGVAYTIEPKLDGKPLKIESFALGDRGLLWIGCRVPGENGGADTGRMVIYEPNGLLFDSIAIPFVPEAINFSPKSWLYVATGEKIYRISVSGSIEAELNTIRLFDEKKEQAEVVRNGRPSIAAMDDFVFVAYPQSNDGRYGVWRLSRDLSVEAEIISGIASCKQQLDIQSDGENLLVAEATRGEIGVYDRDGKRLKQFGKLSSEESGFFGDCNPIAVRPTSINQVLTGELGTGLMKRFNHTGDFVATVAKLPIDPTTSRIAVDWDNERNWFYFMNTGTSTVSVLLPIDELPEGGLK